MLIGITENGEIKNIKVNEEGEMKVAMDGEIVETSSIQDREVVLNSSVLTIGTETTTINVGKKVTSIMIANYSETSDITVNTGSSNLQVGANLALELPVNIEVENLTITSTEADTKIQLVVKGVE